MRDKVLFGLLPDVSCTGRKPSVKRHPHLFSSQIASAKRHGYQSASQAIPQIQDRGQAGERVDIRLLAFCLLPNHFSWPFGRDAITT
jgi:hypothetical protein